MISIDVLMATAAITSVLCAFTAWIWRGRFAAVHWTLFLAMSIAAAVRGWFYYNINLALVHGRSVDDLIAFSRVVAEFILVIAAFVAIGALVYYYVNIRIEPDK